jgi:putative addiction module killer protein
MNTILRTETFDKWLRKLKDTRGKARIIDRIRSAERGNFSDCHAVGQGIREMRNQKRDIAKAHEMAKLLEEDE